MFFPRIIVHIGHQHMYKTHLLQNTNTFDDCWNCHLLTFHLYADFQTRWLLETTSGVDKTTGCTWNCLGWICWVNKLLTNCNNQCIDKFESCSLSWLKIKFVSRKFVIIVLVIYLQLVSIVLLRMVVMISSLIGLHCSAARKFVN